MRRSSHYTFGDDVLLPLGSAGAGAVRGQPALWAAGEDRHGGQVPGPAERLHLTVAGTHEDSGPLPRRAPPGGGDVARAPRPLRLRPAGALPELLRAHAHLPHAARAPRRARARAHREAPHQPQGGRQGKAQNNNDKHA
eukprot:414499-Prorocentrum_minimum.AAC.2